MKLTILEGKKSKVIAVEEERLGVMNHRDHTVDYKAGRKIIRFTLTEDGFNDLIAHFKKPEVTDEPIPEEIEETVSEEKEESKDDV